MIRRLVFIGIFVVSFGAIFSTTTVDALSRTQPNPDDMNVKGTTVHVLRAHSSGSVTSLSLAAYFDGRNSGGTIISPGNETLTILPATGRVCNDSGGGGDTIGIKISIAGREVYKKKGDCNGIVRDFTIRSTDWADDRANSGRWKANIDIELYDLVRHSNGTIDESKYKQSDDRHRTYYFRAQVSSGGLLSSRENNSKTGYGVVGNASNHDISYTIPFAMPLSMCAATDSVQRVGMWDPDSNTYGTTKIRLQEATRGTSSWSNTSVSPNKSAGDINISSSGNGWYDITGKTGTSAWLNFTPQGSKEYRFQIDNNKGNAAGNVYSFFWPYDTIYSDTDCDYLLTPGLGALGLATDPGATLTINAPVHNKAPFNSEGTQWRITRVEYPNNVPITDINKLLGDANGFSDSEPCAAAIAVKDWRAGGSCDNAWNYVNSKVFAGFDNPFTRGYVTPNNPGKRVCFINSVSRPVSSVQTSKVWRHSAMRCTIIAKQPKVQFLGSDIRVRGLIDTSVSSNIESKTYGSWIEYGVFSTGTNKTASSGSGLGLGSGPKNGNVNTIPSEWSKLTFANKVPPYGGYTPIPSSNTLAYFASLDATAPLSSSSVPTGSGVYSAGDISLSGDIVNDSTSVIIRSTGTVTITGDIKVKDNTYSDIRKLSQLVIIAKDIKIQSSVSRIDAWLLARDSIDTCSNKPSVGLTVNDCNLPLQVNGPTVTNKLYLYRTNGADQTAPGVAAEQFNLRPSAYLWAYNYVNKQDRAQTVYVTELPPRL